MIDNIATVFGGTPRSSQWTKVRNDFIKDHNKCECCGSKNKLQVHHVEPFCVAPERELDPTNLITLCSRCHLLIGHCGWWQTYNPELYKGVDYIKSMIRNRKSCKFGSSGESLITKIIIYILGRWYHF